MARVDGPIELRFPTKFDQADGCWLWKATVHHTTGYGQFWDGRTMKQAHRVAYQLYVGPIPPGMKVCHSCDVRACVNPAHLWLGTQAENMQDCVAKGRMPTLDHPSAMPREKRTAILNDLKAGMSQNRVAVVYGVSTATAHRLAHSHERQQ